MPPHTPATFLSLLLLCLVLLLGSVFAGRIMAYLTALGEVLLP